MFKSKLLMNATRHLTALLELSVNNSKQRKKIILVSVWLWIKNKTTPIDIEHGLII